MSAVLEPDENKEPDNNYLLNSYKNSIQLPLEKLFTHTTFCQQIQNISLDDAKQLLVDLHKLLLSQQVVVSNIAKQDLTMWMNNYDKQ